MSEKILGSASELKILAEAYFEMCDRKRVAITMPGLAYALGFSSTKSLSKYRKGEGYEEYHEEMNRACLRVEQATAELLYDKRVNVAGPVFALKNMGWKDKEPDRGPTVNVTISKEAADLA